MDQESLEKILTGGGGNDSEPKIRRSNRIKSMVEVKLKEQELLFHSTCDDFLHEEDCEIQDAIDDPTSFDTTNYPSTIHYQEDMRESNRGEFIKAMSKEVEDHANRDYWDLATRDKVPEGTKVLDSAWSMKRNRDVMTRKVYK